MKNLSSAFRPSFHFNAARSSIWVALRFSPCGETLHLRIRPKGHFENVEFRFRPTTAHIAAITIILLELPAYDDFLP